MLSTVSARPPSQLQQFDGIRRMLTSDQIRAVRTVQTLDKIQSTQEDAGVEFTSQNGGPGVRLNQRRRVGDRL